jgi:transposase-like protein
MSGHPETTTSQDAINTLLQDGLADGLPSVAQMLLNAAMLLERAAFLQAAPYQRSDQRLGHANGFKSRCLSTPIGKLNLQIPQTRATPEPFRSSLLESGSRVERSLKAAIAEMYLQGVSTRRVEAVVKELCGLEISSTQVSRLTSQLDEEFSQWRSRPLPQIAFLILDATYINVRLDGAVRDCAVLTAIGIRRDNGKRLVLGVSAALSEAEVHWRAFLASLKDRGIGLPDLVTSDAHEGLKAALRAALNASPWQRCQFHLQQNAQAYVPNLAMRRLVAADIRSVFDAPDRPKAEARLAEIAAKYQKCAPKLAAWMEANLPEGLTVFLLPEHCRRRLRTSNMSESLNLRIKRRTRVAGLFPNENSVLRLVTAILIETSEDWETGRAYLSPQTPT